MLDESGDESDDFDDIDSDDDPELAALKRELMACDMAIADDLDMSQFIERTKEERIQRQLANALQKVLTAEESFQQGSSNPAEPTIVETSDKTGEELYQEGLYEMAAAAYGRQLDQDIHSASPEEVATLFCARAQCYLHLKNYPGDLYGTVDSDLVVTHLIVSCCIG